jgi:hypothetical protein
MVEFREVSGHVFRAKYRLPDGRQVQRKIGRAWCRVGSGFHQADGGGVAARGVGAGTGRDAAGDGADQHHGR